MSRRGVDWTLLLGLGSAGLLGYLLLSGDKGAREASPSDLTPSGEPLPDDGGFALSETDALARVLTSEAGSHSQTERLWIGWTIRNRAKKARKTIRQLVCTPTCGPCCKGRPASSARQATEDNMRIAATIIELPDELDPTGGATAFFEPALQDKLVAMGRPGYTKNAAQIRAKWASEGQHLTGSVGRWEFYA